MKSVKEQWHQYYQEYHDASWQKLHNNAPRLKKEPDVMNLMLVRRRNEIQQEDTRDDEDLPEENHEASNNVTNNDTDNNGVVEGQAEELTEYFKELEWFFQTEIETIDHCSLL